MSAERGPFDADASAGRGADWARRLPDWVVLVPLGLLVAPIIALAIYTTSIHQRTETIRSETLTVIAPALGAAQDLIIAVALELESLYEYALQTDPAALAGHQDLARAQQSALARLEAVVLDMDGEARRRCENLLRLGAVWRRTARDSAIVAPPSPGGPMELGVLESLFRQILLEATALQRALNRDIEYARAQIDAAERVDWYATLGLVLLALAASTFTAWLVKRIRQLAVLSEHRRLEAVAALEDRARIIRGITHDVKNPLGAADGSAQLLEMGVSGDLSPAQEDGVRRIRRSIQNALGIISDLIDFSRADAGQLDIELEPTDPAVILEEVAEDFRPQAEANGLTLILEPPAVLDRLVTDRRRVRQIVGNLLSNALKYTPPGGRITLSADRMTSDEAGAEELAAGDWLAVAVTDTGPGIAPADRDRIFEEFYRSGAARAGRAAGAGVGLVISRRIARLLGGDVTVESELGEGSTFTLWLPLGGAASRDRVPPRETH